MKIKQIIVMSLLTSMIITGCSTKKSNDKKILRIATDQEIKTLDPAKANDDTSYDSEADVNVDGNYYGGSWEDPADECTVKSYKEGTTKGNIAGTNASEKLAVKCEAVTVRLVYNKYNE